MITKKGITKEEISSLKYDYYDKPILRAIIDFFKGQYMLGIK